MPVPSMPSLSDFPTTELRKIGAAKKIFKDNFGKIHDPAGDSNVITMLYSKHRIIWKKD